MNVIKNILSTVSLQVPIALIVFGATSAYHFHTGRDLGVNYTNSLYALYAFLAGHAFVQGKYSGGAQ